MEYLSPQAIVGFFFFVGSVAIVLQKVGIIKLPTTRNSPLNNPAPKEITSLKEVQIVQGEILKQHEKRLDKGEEQFDELKDTIGSINTNVGILLDRSER